MDQAQLNWITNFIWSIVSPVVKHSPQEAQDTVGGLLANLRAVILESRRQAIARTEREIALMREYCTRLTADIVTGKLDVREAAAKLTEEKSDGADLLDASELLDESDEPTPEEEP